MRVLQAVHALAPATACVRSARVRARGEHASTRAREALGGLERGTGRDELIVVTDDGSVYTGEKALVMCLWAVKRYRRLARQLSGERGLVLARRVFGFISKYRHGMPPMLLDQKFIESLDEEPC